MPKTRINRILFLILIISFVFASSVKAEFNIANPRGYVNDYANVLTAGQKSSLSSLLTELEAKTGAEVAVVTVNDLQGYAVEDAALQIGRKWGVGEKGKNNGIVFLTAVKDRKTRIEVGYGLEGAINDAKAGRIIDRYVIPYFKQGQYGQGISAGTAAIASTIAREYKVSLSGSQGNHYVKTPQRRAGGSGFWNFLFILFLIYMFIRHPRLMILLMLSGGFGGRSSSGGGFGGFGGGSFGGGGASRGW